MIHNLLDEYCSLNKEIIKLLQEDKIDEISNYMDKKDVIINNLKEQKYDPKDYIEYVREIKIMELDISLGKLIEEKKSEIKKKQQEMKNNATSVNQYNKMNFGNYNRLHKTI